MLLIVFFYSITNRLLLAKVLSIILRMHKPKKDEERRTIKTKPSCSLLDTDDSQKLPVNNRKKSGKSTILNVTLCHKKKMLCSFNLDSEEHTTSDLLDYSLGVLRNSLKENVLGVECGNSELDYYLQCPQKSLEVFKSSLTLTPFIESAEKGINRYRFLKVIGVGGFSKVYLARSKRDGKFYAVKLLEKRKVIENKKTRVLMNERNILSRVNHSFILKLYECFETHLFFCFVLQYCPGGELFYSMSKNRKFTEQQIKFYCCELLDTISYLHKRSILYRDLKPENILLDAEGHLKLIDFGLSKCGVPKEAICTTFCGSPPYMPPEIIKKVGHGFPVDFYCLGALMYQLACGYPPFGADNESQIFYAILHNDVEYPESLGKTFKSLLKGLLNKDPNLRLGSQGGVEEILTHKFFQTANINEILARKCAPPIIPRISSLNVTVQNVVTEFIDLQKKLEIEMQLQCNIYEKTLPSFEFINYNLKPLKSDTRRNEYDNSTEQYFANDTNPFMKKQKLKEKSIKKSTTKPQLTRYNSVRNMSSKSKGKSRNNSRSQSKNNSKTNIKPNKEAITKPSSKERKVIFGYYFDKKLKSPPMTLKDSSKQLIHQFSMTNISSHVYFS